MSSALQVQQPLGRPDHDPPSFQIYVSHDLGNRGHEMLARPVADDPQILRGRRLHPQHLAHIAPVLRQDATALELPRVEVPLGRRQRFRFRQREQPSGQGGGRLRRLVPGDADDERRRLPPRRRDPARLTAIVGDIPEDALSQRLEPLGRVAVPGVICLLTRNEPSSDYLRISEWKLLF